MRVVAMSCSALLSARSPPRLRRCRVTRPLEAGMGAAPASFANAASLGQRPGWDQDTIAWAALTGPIPTRSVIPGDHLVDDDGQVFCSRAGPGPAR